MKKSVFLFAVAALAGTASPAVASPDKPLNASMVGHGYGCFLHDGNGVESFDPGCSTFTSVKLTADGSVQHFIYHDSAQLQPGQTAPDSAVVNWVNYEVFGLQCEGEERITPSGRYSSNQVCTPL